MDERYLAYVMQTYSKLLWAVVLGYLPKSYGFTNQDIEECVADIFISFASSPESYDQNIGDLKSYLCGIARNKAIDFYRQRMRRNEVPFGAWEDSPELLALAYRALLMGDQTTLISSSDNKDPLAQLSQKSEYDLLYDAVNRLDEPNREIVLRRFFLEQKPSLISDEMGIDLKEVNNRLYRSKQQLAALFQKSLEITNER